VCFEKVNIHPSTVGTFHPGEKTHFVPPNIEITVTSDFNGEFNKKINVREIHIYV
jgi:hypothetical protein